MDVVMTPLGTFVLTTILPYTNPIQKYFELSTAVLGVAYNAPIALPIIIASQLYNAVRFFY